MARLDPRGIDEKNPIAMGPDNDCPSGPMSEGGLAPDPSLMPEGPVHPLKEYLHQNWKSALLAGALFLALAAVFMTLVGRWIPTGWDFGGVFRPAAGMILQGRSPYEVEGFFSPFWAAMLFIPFALLPEQPAWGLFLFLSIALYLMTLIRMRARGLDAGWFLSSPFVFYSLRFGNIDALLLLAGTLSPAVGLWILALKPQMSAGLMFFWGLQMFARGWRPFIKAFLPVGLAMAMSLWMSGRNPGYPLEASWNVSVWPWGIPIGLGILFLAFRRRHAWLAFASGPFLSPYLAIQSWMITMPAGFGKRWAFGGWLAGWLVVVLRGALGEQGGALEQIPLVIWGLGLMAIFISPGMGSEDKDQAIGE